MEWRPIETAPKDGTTILLVWRRVDLAAWQDNPVAAKDAPLAPPEIVIGSWYSWLGAGAEEWHGHGVRDHDGSRSVSRLTNGTVPGVGPTHWMPLPDLPSP